MRFYLLLAALALQGSPGPHPAEIMAHMVSSTLALKRFRCTMEIQIRNPDQSTRTDTYSVAYAGPSRIAVKEIGTKSTPAPGKAASSAVRPLYDPVIVADGSRYYVLLPDRRHYVINPLNDKPAKSQDDGLGAFQDFTVGDILINDDHELVSRAQSSGRLIGHETVAGAMCDEVVVGDAIYWVARADGLVRRVATRIPGGVTITETYTYQDVGKSPSASEFAIQPPAGAEKVSSARR